MPLRTLIFKDDIVFYKFINMFIKLCWECVFNDPGNPGSPKAYFLLVQA